MNGKANHGFLDRDPEREGGVLSQYPVARMERPCSQANDERRRQLVNGNIEWS